MGTESKQQSWWGEQARAILRQYNEAYYCDYKFHGPHYVVYERGEFKMRPFGGWAHQRYWFEVRPEFLPGQAEPFWTFMVM